MQTNLLGEANVVTWNLQKRRGSLGGVFRKDTIQGTSIPYLGRVFLLIT